MKELFLGGREMKYVLEFVCMYLMVPAIPLLLTIGLFILDIIKQIINMTKRDDE